MQGPKEEVYLYLRSLFDPVSFRVRMNPKFFLVELTILSSLIRLSVIAEEENFLVVQVLQKSHLVDVLTGSEAATVLELDEVLYDQKSVSHVLAPGSDDASSSCAK